jgi:peptidoglycan/LPS O-acetylase OafA/YrhL
VRYRPDIDGLRALAVALVVLGHLGLPGLRGGYVGVDVFFVISGFLILSTMPRVEPGGEGARFSLGAFLFRRARRILPASAVVIVLTVAAAWVLLQPVKAIQISREGAWAAAFLANLELIRQATDYFQQALQASPFQHYWSLAVEEQFYLLAPGLVGLALIGGRGLPRRGWWGRLLAMIGTLTLASFILALVMSVEDPVRAYYASAARAWEIGIGACLGVLTLRWRPRLHPAVREFLALGSLAVILTSAFVYTEHSAFPGWRALAPTLATAAFLLAATGAERAPWTSRVVGLAPLALIGRMSFSIYLFHWPLIVLLPRAVPGIEHGPAYPLVVAAATLLLAAASWRWVERPFRSLPVPARFARDGRPWLPILFSSLGVAALLTLGLARSAPESPGADELDAVIEPDEPNEPDEPDEPDEPADHPALLERQRALVQAGNRLLEAPAELRPPIDQLLDQRGAQWRSCMDPDTEGIACELGPPDATRTLVVLGDSMALALYPMLQGALGTEEWRLVGLNKRECMVADVTPCPGTTRGPDPSCPAHRLRTLALLDEIQPDLIVLSDLPAYPIADEEGACGEDIQAWGRGSRRALEDLVQRGAPVVYVGLPTRAVGLTDCLDRQGRIGPQCWGSPADLASYRQIQRSNAEGVGARFLDPTGWTCLEGRCPPIIGGVAVYWDGVHFTEDFAASLAPLFAAWLRAEGLLEASARTAE